jgi:glycosyltransferase involved in cell wall biosynthesis
MKDLGKTKPIDHLHTPSVLATDGFTAEAHCPGQERQRTSSPRVAVLIPCYNEELTVGKVVRDFRNELPAADIYVFDNNSTDQTVEIARKAGARVTFERRQGKGYVVQRMFEEVEADVYVMVDGDDTYAATDVHKLMVPILDGHADMVG